jgi:hypothetical protein
VPTNILRFLLTFLPAHGPQVKPMFFQPPHTMPQATHYTAIPRIGTVPIGGMIAPAYVRAEIVYTFHQPGYFDMDISTGADCGIAGT